MPEMLHRVAPVVLAACVVFAASGCGDDPRSADAFCHALERNIADLRAHAASVEVDDPIQTGLNALAMVGRVRTALNDLRDHAPDEIKGAMDELASVNAENLETSLGSISNPAAGLVEALTRSALSIPAAEQVTSFIEQHCDIKLPTR